jgi:quinol monooxygenase YgiN
VRANEPGNLAYQLAKSRTEANTYKVLEIYADQDALTHHGGTDYFKAAGPKFGAVLAGPAGDRVPRRRRLAGDLPMDLDFAP